VPNISKKHSLSLPIVNAIIAEDDPTATSISPYIVEEHEERAAMI